ncbi:WecB/TagA/CpsF family glycosyltransferase [Microvirga roseola]|uniref:WecB/TagA/CpsF family glycosyltransferase n=1 Tax=Microvirga roseola TaxID=2883126 RepID=UPI001E3EDB62|nr:WecB/TagA/CpsF family glycosyltransferase [Microvirga roseola]
MEAGQVLERRTVESVLGVSVDAMSWDEAGDRIFSWAANRESRVVCVCSVHSIVTARQDKAHGHRLQAADMVTPDGAPVAWTLRRKGHVAQDRINGPDLMMKCCQRAAETGEKIFLYGGSFSTLQQLEKALLTRFPGLQIAGAISPPFRELTEDENAAIVEQINDSGASIVWVGLGCPKQEIWMHANRGRINAVIIGVGAAFDFHSGAIKRAPLWMQRNGLEWLYRLSQDPRRLAGRYLVTNSIFVWATLQEMMLSKGRARKPGRISKSAGQLDQ